MANDERIRVEFLEVDPQQSPVHEAPELYLPDDDELAQEYLADMQQAAVGEDPQIIETQKVVRRRHERAARPGRLGRRIKTVAYAGGAALAFIGAMNVYHSLTNGGGSHMQVEAAVEETWVTVYQNPKLELAGIDSDLSLEMSAGYDRTGPIPGIDINPVNNMYEFRQRDLTTHTEATLMVEEMEVKESPDQISVTLTGEMDLSNPSIDWDEEEFAGADISRTSYSVGNNLKDEIDNDALEILQDSAGVAAACALLDRDVRPAITSGVGNFLRIVSPGLFDKDKPMNIVIQDLESQAESEYITAKRDLEDTIREIASDYDGPNDTFDADISQILDCDAQDIRLAPSPSATD